MKRRSVRVGTLALTLHLLASSLVAVAQPTGKVHRIGILRHFACPDEFGLKDLRQRLGELGYIEGRNIVIECRAAPGKWEELPELAAELVRLNIDVLVTEGTPASLAAKQATRLVPVIMAYVGDPVASGLVSSLGRTSSCSRRLLPGSRASRSGWIPRIPATCRPLPQWKPRLTG